MVLLIANLSMRGQFFNKIIKYKPNHHCQITVIQLQFHVKSPIIKIAESRIAQHCILLVAERGSLSLFVHLSCVWLALWGRRGHSTRILIQKQVWSLTFTELSLALCVSSERNFKGAMRQHIIKDTTNHHGQFSILVWNKSSKELKSNIWT